MATLLLAGWVCVRDLEDWRFLTHVKAKSSALQTKLDEARAAQASSAVEASKPTPFSVDARRRMAIAEFDSAGVLRSIESAQVVGARISRLEVDAEARRVELELEVSSADVAANYLQALNAGEDRPPWTLLRLQVQGGAETALIRGQMP